MPRALAVTLALLLAGCPSAYLQATGQFAQAARDGAGSLVSAFDLSTQLCRDRADLACRPRDCLPVVAGARSDDAGRTLGRVEP